MGVFQNLDTVRSTAPLAVTFAEALFEEQREQNRKVKSNIQISFHFVRGQFYLDGGGIYPLT